MACVVTYFSTYMKTREGLQTFKSREEAEDFKARLRGPGGNTLGLDRHELESLEIEPVPETRRRTKEEVLREALEVVMGCLGDREHEAFQIAKEALDYEP